MERMFFGNKKSKCLILVVKKEKSFDQSFKGDFNLQDNIINRSDKNNLAYIFTGLQIVDPEVFLGIDLEVFSINKIWDTLISNNQLYGTESNANFFHISTIEIYEKLYPK